MKHKFIQLLLGIFIFQFSASAQENTQGKIEIIQDPEIESLMSKHIEINEANETIDGFRIQIHFGGEREKAKNVKTKFLQQFADIPAYELYQQPNFKIRVGDYRTRLEAQKAMIQITPYFASAFIVADEINLPQLETKP